MVLHPGSLFMKGVLYTLDCAGELEAVPEF